jgi:hypothetical protein
MTDRNRPMIPEWAQYVMALSPCAVVVGLMLYLYFNGFRSRGGKRAAASNDVFQGARERGQRVRERRQSE